MERLINKRLLKYYCCAHPDFVNSKSFCKTALQTAQSIKDNPNLVYYTLQSIVDELNARRKDKSAVVTDDQTTPKSTGDIKLDRKLRKLNAALVSCNEKIKRLEEEEVNFDDEINSSHLVAERFKDRAWKLYYKICELTGEGSHANRIVRKAIKFNDTNYIEFNKAVQSFCNRTLKFPDFYDILKIMERCNTEFQYGLGKGDVKHVGKY